MLNGFRRWGEIDYNGIIPWGVNSSGGNKKKEETHTHTHTQREREREREKENHVSLETSQYVN